MDALPLDLIPQILEHNYFSAPTPSVQVDVDSLSAYSLVCRCWTDLAQRLLFRSLSISNKHRNFGTMRRLFLQPYDGSSSHRMMTLASYVRDLHVTDVNTISSGKEEDSFAVLLPLFLNVYTLNLDSLIRTGPAAPSLPNIVQSTPQLRIRALELKCDLNSPAVFELLETLHSIRFLRIAGEIAAHSSWFDRFNNPTALQELLLHRTPKPVFLEWLLSSSAGSLQILEFRDLPGSQILPVLSNYCSQIRSLRFMRWEKSAASLAKMCRNLEELVVYHTSNLVPFADLPSTIQHFSFRNLTHSRSDNLAPVFTAMDSLPNLRTVTCSDALADNETTFTALKIRCAARSVEIKLEKMPFWQYDDPVMVEHFPRSKSVGNWPLMHG